MKAPLHLRTRVRWLRLRVALAALILPPGARAFEKLGVEAAGLMAEAEAHVRRCKAALNDV